MKKTKLELLQKALTVLKNAARARKEELAFLAGFDNVVDYKANLIARIAAEETADVKSEEEPAQEGLNMVLAFDCTASMNDWIVAVREHAKQTITEIFENQPDAKIKVIAFGDYCDMKSETEFGKAYQESELSNDVDYLVDFINNTKNTYGGDSDEFYELVIKKIVEETKWDSSRRSVLLIGDAAPHAVGYRHINCKGNQIDWRKECKKSSRCWYHY